MGHRVPLRPDPPLPVYLCTATRVDSPDRLRPRYPIYRDGRIGHIPPCTAGKNGRAPAGGFARSPWSQPYPGDPMPIGQTIGRGISVIRAAMTRPVKFLRSRVS
jgi:hypothetical protein